MMDTEGFIDRFKQLLEDNNMSASALADEIDVQRSSISHILSGRNKPSLDFILKVLKRFPDINIYWLMNGTQSKASPIVKKENTVEIQEEKQDNIEAIIAPIVSTTKKIKHIVIFYEDATFDSYTPN
ncbi:MAG: helix-turn-helix transcriptional regulator [Flavobacteriales bacterium]|nr:helix-turn-helix transcriptional regulator [Flavobacteriales bacterium]